MNLTKRWSRIKDDWLEGSCRFKNFSVNLKNSFFPGIYLCFFYKWFLKTTEKIPASWLFSRLLKNVSVISRNFPENLNENKGRWEGLCSLKIFRKPQKLFFHGVFLSFFSKWFLNITGKFLKSLSKKHVSKWGPRVRRGYDFRVIVIPTLRYDKFVELITPHHKNRRIESQ